MTRAQKTAAKKTATGKTASKRPTRSRKTPARDDKGTVVQLRPKLATRRKTATGPYTADQLTESRACQASAMAALPIPVLAWTVPAQTTSDRAAAHLADGTVITHVAHRAPVFTTDIPCRHGARHHHTIRTANELHRYRQAAATCEQQHANDDQHQAITEGVRPTTATQPTKVNGLAEGIKRANASVTDTQPLSEAEIAAHIAAQLADQTPKEHPQP
jgi:hypothetical protein